MSEPRITDRRIVLAAHEVPGEGGASTAAYALFRKMQACGLDVHLVNIIDLELLDYYRYVFGDRMGNPDGLENVHNCVLHQASFLEDPDRTPLPGLLDDIAADIAVGMDNLPTSMVKRSRPRTPVVFLACGSEQARIRIAHGGLRDTTALQRSLRGGTYPPEPFNSPEVRAVQDCDLLVANSILARDLYRLFYPASYGKIAEQPVWFAEWICEDAAHYADLARPYSERGIDLLFVASSWKREVKNWRLARQVISDCRDLDAWVIGKLDRTSPHAHFTGFVDSRRELFEIMGNARAVVSTSMLDTAPGVLFEAALMGCNVVASRNCGNWELCDPDLLVDRYARRDFADRCRDAVQAPRENRLDRFLTQGSYQRLLDSIAVL